MMIDPGTHLEDFHGIAFGRSGEFLAARLRAVAIAAVALIPITSLVLHPDAEAVAGTLVAGVALIVALIAWRLARSETATAWFRIGTCVLDVSFVTACHALFVAAGAPLAATNGRVAFSCYYIALALVALRNDPRLVVCSTSLAALQYAAVLGWAHARYSLTSLPSSHAYGVFRWDNQASRLAVLFCIGGVMAIVVARSRHYWSAVLHFLDAIPLGIVVADRGERVEFANRAAQSLFGRPICSQTSLADLRRSMLAADCDTSLPVERDALVRALAGEEASLDELRIARPDGIVDAQAWGVPLRDRDGAIRRAIAIVRDRTSEVRAEGALRDSNRFVDSILENIPHMIFVKDARDLRFVRLNRAGEELLGLPRSAIEGRTDRDLFPPAEADAFVAADRAVLATGSAVDIPRETLHSGAHGMRVLHTKKVALRDAHGQPAFLLGISEDVTEQLRREERLRLVEHEVHLLNSTLEGRVEVRTRELAEALAKQSELQALLRASASEWQATFDAVESPMLVVDVEAVVRRCNRSAKKALGRPWFEIVGRALGDLASEDPWRSLSKALPEVFASNEEIFRTVADKSGRTRWELTLTRLHSEERSLAVVVLRDVSNLVELQESLARASTLATVGSLVAGVAHEVRNPLFAMTANLEDLEEDLLGAGRTDARVLNLRSAADRLDRLMKELLDYARPSEPTFETFDLPRILENSMAACAALLQNKGVTLEARATLPAARLRAQPDRLAQVFQNLFENAIHFSPPGAAVTIECALEGGTVVVSVVDTGPGFPAGAAQHVFEPFYSRRRGGVGLGLAIAQRIVEQHGGIIQARNRPQGGGEVTVRLPTIDEPEARPGHAIEPSDGPARGLR